MTILSSTGKRVAVVYVGLFFSYGIFLPFYPLLLADHGMGDTEIALLIAVPMALRAALASPLGILADRIGNHRYVLTLYSFVAASAFSLFPLARGFWALLAVSVVTSLFSNASTPVTDALATSVVRRGGGDYGRMRMWGSMSFVVANVVGGALISGMAAQVVFWISLVSLWGAFVVLATAPPSGFGNPRPDLVDTTDVARIESHTIRPHFLKDRVLVAGMVAAALFQSSHAMIYGFSSLYWGQIGFSGTMIGIFWATGVVAETLMFFLSGRLFRSWGAGQMLMLSGFAALCRWLLFPVLTSVPGYLALQSLHALTFACCHLAMMRLVVTRVPERVASTVQGVYATLGAFTMSAATLVSGPLYRIFGGTGFQLMSGFVVVGLLISLIWVGTRRQAAFDVA
jgi:PPP family 3-phenylpropionic acid transporter